MQGLRPYVQDENALAGLHRPAALKGALLGGEPGGLGLGGARKGTPGFPQGARKALGNITNRGGVDAENAPPGKTPAGGAAPRRALGDITNSNAGAPTSLRPAAAQKPAALQQAQQQGVAVPAAAAVAQAASRADVLAEGGVERMAGRGWEALERDRLAREDAESRQRLAALANFPARQLPTFFPFWGGPSVEQALKKDVLPTPPASPMAKQLGSGAGGSLSLPDLGDLSLPDVALPDIEDALGDLGGF